jgi:hypothetical protein
MPSRPHPGLRLLSLALALLAGVAAAPPAGAAGANPAGALREPADPLRSTVAIGFGVLALRDAAHGDFFDRSELNTWSLRYDYRVWGPLRLGSAVVASQKCEVAREVSLASGPSGEVYPVRFRFTAFTAFGELFLRSPLPRVGPLYPHASAGLLVSRIHAESSGYSLGYEAGWEDYRPLAEVVKYGHGWRAALGLHWPLWANVALVVEGSRQELDRYDAPTDRDPPVGAFSHSGDRLEIGLLQRF